MHDENALAFQVLSDRNSFVASIYGIVFALTPADQALFIQIGNDLPKRNGDNSWLLPAPATFVIAGDGIIRDARVDADHTSRIDPDEIVAAMRAIVVDERSTR